MSANLGNIFDTNNNLPYFFDFFGIMVSLFWFLNELCGTKSTYCYLQKYLYAHKYTLLLLKYYKSIYNYTF